MSQCSVFCKKKDHFWKYNSKWLKVFLFIIEFLPFPSGLPLNNLNSLFKVDGKNPTNWSNPCDKAQSHKISFFLLNFLGLTLVLWPYNKIPCWEKRPFLWKFVNVNDQVLKKDISFRFPYSRDGGPVSRLFDVWPRPITQGSSNFVNDGVFQAYRS